jgi:hypothetical protein
MAFTERLKQEIQRNIGSGDVRAVRIALKDSLLIDPTFGEFNQMFKLAQSMPGLWDPHNGDALREPPWTDNYMNEQMVQIVFNFSQERLEHLKKVVRARRPTVAKPAPEPRGRERQKIGKSVAICGSALVLVGLVASSRGTMVVGAVTAAAGAVCAASETKRGETTDE